MKKNKLFGIIIAIAVVAVAIFMFMGNGMEHIEDTNGAENFALQTITDENIINKDIGAIGGPNMSTDNISNTTTYSSKKFTGVAEIYGVDITTTSMDITVNHASVTEGNFKLVLLVDDKIVHEFKLNELSQTYTLEKPSGYVSLVIAGESANFEFDYHID